ncbi:hypothetical protein LshimejAT787_1105420 [Lyophyllum shimeji]|uniref:Uncharacterized protein n=1 Tax=Lyophyllum shimeji TaxID=47721 RepID=A0A9P3PWG1_LYOSH|nr:hypothetical protein LshimejAT787_1105420 [Lyophyllum shimeji]
MLHVVVHFPHAVPYAGSQRRVESRNLRDKERPCTLSRNKVRTMEDAWRQPLLVSVIRIVAWNEAFRSIRDVLHNPLPKCASGVQGQFRGTSRDAASPYVLGSRGCGGVAAIKWSIFRSFAVGGRGQLWRHVYCARPWSAPILRGFWTNERI